MVVREASFQTGMENFRKKVGAAHLFHGQFFIFQGRTHAPSKLNANRPCRTGCVAVSSSRYSAPESGEAETSKSPSHVMRTGPSRDRRAQHGRADERDKDEGYPGGRFKVQRVHESHRALGAKGQNGALEGAQTAFRRIGVCQIDGHEFPILPIFKIRNAGARRHGQLFPAAQKRQIARGTIPAAVHQNGRTIGKQTEVARVGASAAHMQLRNIVPECAPSSTCCCGWLRSAAAEDGLRPFRASRLPIHP